MRETIGKVNLGAGLKPDTERTDRSHHHDDSHYTSASRLTAMTDGRRTAKSKN